MFAFSFLEGNRNSCFKFDQNKSTMKLPEIPTPVKLVNVDNI